MEINNRIIQYVYESNRIDFNTIQPDSLTLEDVKAVALGQKSIPEIEDHLKAIGQLIDMAHSDKPMIMKASDIVLPLHKTLMGRLLSPAEAGVFRKHGVWIGDEIMPSHRFIPQYMERLNGMIYTAKTRRDWDDCYNAHLEFECIHPFADGNGRVGRLLLNYLLMRVCGAPFETVIPYDERRQYYERIRLYRRMKFTSLEFNEARPGVSRN